MKATDVVLNAAAGRIARGAVLAAEDGMVLVGIEGRDPVGCEMLDSGSPPPALASGDAVLVWLGPEDDTGVVLGRIGAPRCAPDELVIEARKNLTIRCGEGSITLRGDGKILIKGKDLVSRAQRMNRVKGGAVAIN